MGDDYEAIYVRTCTQGVVHDDYLHMGTAKSSTSADIHTHILETFEELNLADEFSQKLVGFCSDGAANMQGVKSGLAALLKVTRPHLVSVHCLAHRLELAFKDLVKNNKQYQKIMTLLLGLYYLYRQSPKLKNGLQESFRSLNIKQVLPTRVGGTRWLPHMEKAMSRFLKGYVAIRHHLESASHVNPKAEGLAKIAADGHAIVFLLCLKTVVCPLVILSKFLLKESITLADATTMLSTTKNSLSLMSTQENAEIQEVIDTKMYKGETLKIVGQIPGIVVGDLAAGAMDCILSRFPESSLVDSTIITSFNSWPDSESDLRDFGKEAIVSVSNHFKDVLQRADIETEELEPQWQQLKVFIATKYKSELQKGTLKWATVNRVLQDSGYDDILDVIDLLQSLPPTSVRNECSFSSMKLTKHKRRGRLQPSTLNSLMVVKELSEDIEHFDPKTAIEDFLESCFRHISSICHEYPNI